MTHIKVKKGLDIPISGKPEGKIQTLQPSKTIGLDFSGFPYLRTRMLVKVGDRVSMGQPIAADKVVNDRQFVSPISGKVLEIRRGVRRSIHTIVIEPDEENRNHSGESLSLESMSKDQIVKILSESGLFVHIKERPFGFMARHDRLPRSIFIQAIESAPFAPLPEYQIEGYEEEFALGLKVLHKICEGRTHLVKSKESSSFHTEQVHVHTAEGPHPVANPSVHIHMIDPILSTNDIVWTLNVSGVISIGSFFKDGSFHNQRIVTIAGPGVIKEKRGFFRVPLGCHIGTLFEGRKNSEKVRLISGDPLMGSKVSDQDFLGLSHTGVCAFEETHRREFLHFFGWGRKKYTTTGVYLSRRHEEFAFDTLKHGEVRAFVDGNVYQKVMPMRIPVMHLVKAVLAEDFQSAEELGLLEVVSEDFALPTFLCPSKIEMVDIIEKGLKKYAEELTLLC